MNAAVTDLISMIVIGLGACAALSALAAFYGAMSSELLRQRMFQQDMQHIQDRFRLDVAWLAVKHGASKEEVNKLLEPILSRNTKQDNRT